MPEWRSLRWRSKQCSWIERECWGHSWTAFWGSEPGIFLKVMEIITVLMGQDLAEDFVSRQSPIHLFSLPLESLFSFLSSSILYARLGFNSNFGSWWDWKSARVKPPTDLGGHAQMSRLFFIYSYMEIRQHWRLLCGLTLPKPSVSIYVILIQDPGFPLFPTLCSCS